MKLVMTVLACALALPAHAGQRVTNAGSMTYHGGPVLHTQIVFTIFWNPTTTPFPAAYQPTITRFIQDLNGNPYYGVLTQYGDGAGTISPNVFYASTWLDTTNPYPSAALTYADLLAEVNRAIAANGWASGDNIYYQVYTAAGIGSSAGAGLCGKHWFADPQIGQVMLPTGICVPGGVTPNAPVVDGGVIASAREIFDAASDPHGNAWYYLDPLNEVGDLCINDFGNRAPSGANLVMNGRQYLVQRMWSNLAGGCVLGSGAQVAAPTDVRLTRTEPAVLRLTWTPVTDATTYGYGLSTTPGGPYTSYCCFTLAQDVGVSRGVTYYLIMWAVGSAGVGPVSPPVTFSIPLVDTPFDYDGDHHADLTVWRPSTGTWFSLKSSTGFNPAAALSRVWGSNADHDVPVSGDLDGDGRGDLVVWRPGTGTWFWLRSRYDYDYATQQQKQWGAPGDVPMLGDIDGDGRADLIVWRPSTGYWYWLTSSSGYDYASQGQRQWGTPGDVPMLGTFDSDGRADLAVWRPGDGTFYWLTSATSYDYLASGHKQWGRQSLGDRPFLGEIDGDGRSDLVVWRASTGTWFWVLSSASYADASQGQQVWGSAAENDVPMLTDIDGDGRVDLTVWRPGDGTWYWLTSASSYNYAAQQHRQWGGSDDIPMNK